MKLFDFYKAVLSIVAFSFLTFGASWAGEQGNAAEAEAMAKKAIAYIKANGPEKAAKEFTTGTTFKDRDLYIAFTDLNGNVLGHGGNAKLVGKNLTGLKDPDGKLFFQMLVDVAKTKGKGWSDSYKFLNPVTSKIESKVMYVERIDDNWIGVGIYKN